MPDTAGVDQPRPSRSPSVVRRFFFALVGLLAGWCIYARVSKPGSASRASARRQKAMNLSVVIPIKDEKDNLTRLPVPHRGA